MSIRWALLACASLSIGCAGPTLAARSDAARPAVSALQGGRFEEAEKLARAAGDDDPDNPYARLVRAIVRAKKTHHQLALDGRTLLAGLMAGSFNDRYARTTLTEVEAQLAEVDSDLAAAGKHKGLSLELCLACWDIDWNGDGVIDERDRELLEIERDERGERIPEGDPRRRPTFRFDDGDVPWARAFVSFERAALDVVLAYDLTELGRLGRRWGSHPIALKLVAPERIAQAKERILSGLDQSDACRRAYLAETDDDREWVPSPRQKSHPMPLQVDQALYDTWEGVVGDVRRLVRGDEALPIAPMLTLMGETSETMPRGFLAIGRMFDHPKDIRFDPREIDRLDRTHDVEAMAAAVLGEYYVPEAVSSPLPRRLARMKSELDDGREQLGHKLRYLFWLN